MEKKRKLFQYPPGFDGIELIKSCNKQGTEAAAWLNNPAGPGKLVLVGFIRPEEWEEFENAFNILMERYVVGIRCFPAKTCNSLKGEKTGGSNGKRYGKNKDRA